MQIGMVGLGRMGANMVRRLMRDGHECVVTDHHEENIREVESEGALGAKDVADFVKKLDRPRRVWLMIPAGAVDSAIQELGALLDEDDVVIDGGNSYFKDDIRRARTLGAKGIHYVDVGVSGGVFGLERGYCLMIGGEREVVGDLGPVFESLSPPMDSAPRTASREGEEESTAEHGWLHCGPAGAGHFVKMVHNGIEYGVMAAYAEGLNILHQANVGKEFARPDAETAPMREPEAYQYDFNIAEITEVWRRGSVIASWLLDLTADALHEDPDLEKFGGRVSDSGEGRWTVMAAIDESVPAPVLSAALYQRFSSRGESLFADKTLSAMRYKFGGHREKKKD